LVIDKNAWTGVEKLADKNSSAEGKEGHTRPEYPRWAVAAKENDRHAGGDEDKAGA
jgi:hypothetical protein